MNPTTRKSGLLTEDMPAPGTSQVQFESGAAPRPSRALLTEEEEERIMRERDELIERENAKERRRKGR